MKKIICAASLALAATPAMAADFTGAHVEVKLGYEKFDDIIDPDGISYGVQVGYSHEVAAGFVVGAEVGFGDSSTKALGGLVKTDRDLSAMVKMGPKLGSNTLLYVTGGYTNLKIDGAGTTESGWRAGLGLEQALGDLFYVSTEYTFSNYGYGSKKHEATVGAGLRF